MLRNVETRRRSKSDLTSENPLITSSASFTSSINSTMPVTRGIERGPVTLSNSPPKHYGLHSSLTTQYEENDGTSSTVGERLTTKRMIDLGRKSNSSAKHSSNVNSTRRTTVHEVTTRLRSNTDVQSIVVPNQSLKQQQSQSNNSGSDKALNHSQTPVNKPNCLLPQATPPQGYITPSKLFNMMGYGLENQYLFMYANYLYIIDCRSREEFDEKHITTAIHWEDALNETVYISLVERFSEILLYDKDGFVSKPTPEISKVIEHFFPAGSKSCAFLMGGFNAFYGSYPFICTRSNIRSIVDREKFLTIYPSVILENQLYLGTGHQATDWKVVRDLKLTHIINISIEHQCVFADKIKYLHLQLEDKEEVQIKNHFQSAIQFIENALKSSSNRVLVHCNLGISRSSSLILAYLMKNFNATFTESFRFVRCRRPIVCPNVGFLQQLIEFEYDLFSYSYSDPNDPIFH